MNVANRPRHPRMFCLNFMDSVSSFAIKWMNCNVYLCYCATFMFLKARTLKFVFLHSHLSAGRLEFIPRFQIGIPMYMTREVFE
ncbi:hypothetical protein FKM82_025833 [Ascaphus truei]